MLESISYKNIWKISTPIIISGIAQNVVNVTDTMFLGWVGNVELGAAGNAGIFYFVLILTGMGFTTGTQIIIGRRNGEKNYNQIGKVFDHTIYFVVPFGILLFMVMQLLAPLLLELITKSPHILDASIQYLTYRSYGISFAFINFAFIAFFVGITKTRMLIYVTVLMMLINVGLDYTLIFGNFGFPVMGVEGAALASTISEISAFLFFAIYTLKKVDIKKYNLFQFGNFESAVLKRIFNVGSPIMLQNFMSISSWFIFFMIIEKIGEKELAISHIIRSIYMVLVIPIFGFSSATNTLVSNLIGQGNKELVLPLIKKVTVLSLIVTTFIFVINQLIPEQIIHLYTTDPNLMEDALATLNVISLTMFFFCIAYVLFNGVTGTGNTKVSMVIEAITITIYLVLTYYIVIYLKSSLPIVWCTEFIYFGLLGILSFIYLKKGNWGKNEI